MLPRSSAYIGSSTAVFYFAPWSMVPWRLCHGKACIRPLFAAGQVGTKRKDTPEVRRKRTEEKSVRALVSYTPMEPRMGQKREVWDPAPAWRTGLFST